VPLLVLLTALAGTAPGGVSPHPHHRTQRTIRPAAGGGPLTAPSVLVNQSHEPHTVEVTLTAAVTHLALVPGLETAVFAYNGQVPGPTLEVWEGDSVIVHFRNALPEPTTIHWHGIHLPFHADGSPFDPVKPGEQYDYTFTVTHGTAGTYWYHPHPDHRASPEVAKGLFGAIIVRAADDPLRGLVTEKLLILHDNRFLSDGSVDLPDPDSPAGRRDFENGREGNVLFVNGQVMPTISIRAGEVQRWRVINASAARVYRLAIPGHPFLHVGSDGGLFEHPVEQNEILVANTERVELLVRGTGKPGERDTLEDLPYNRYIPQTRPADWDSTRNLLTLQYSDEPPVAPVAFPTTLRVVPWLDTTAVTARRVFALSQGLINGQTMDMNRVDVVVPLGATEIWEIENLVGMDHPFHLHGFRFQVLDRDGVPEPYASWKDTVNVPKHETVRLIVKFEDYPGLWMFHCHILDHEDAGMMGVLQVK
jgi:FtsP/CotA-like multicopper oxidase with cupredoxin domain